MNPLPTNGNLTWKDAALVATILMAFSMATLYVPFHPYEEITADVYRAVFNLVEFAGVAWITFFVSLTGLNAYAKQAQANGTATT